MGLAVCPVDPQHDRFYARHCESVAHELTAGGEYVDEIKNSYDGEGYEGPLYCLDCDKQTSEAIAIDSKTKEPIQDFDMWKIEQDGEDAPEQPTDPGAGN